MKARIFTVPASLSILAACAPVAGQTDIPPRHDQGYQCNNDSLASFVGQIATAEVGAAILATSGAKTLRWAPPRTAMTMDFRPDRVTVGYDDNLVIDRISCG